MRATLVAAAVSAVAAGGGGHAPPPPPRVFHPHPPVHALRGGGAHDVDDGALCLRWDLLKTNASAPDRWPRRPWHHSQNAAWEPHAEPATLPLAASVGALEQGFRDTRRRLLWEGGAAAGALGVGRQLHAPTSSLARQLQPPPGGTSGSVASTACSPSSGTCTVPSGSTSSASTTLALSYSTATGKFSGTITTNQVRGRALARGGY
jgi:hypothetical protein